MNNIFTDYPNTLWPRNWSVASSPADSTPFVTSSICGELTALNAEWTLQLVDTHRSYTIRIFHNALSFSTFKIKNPNRTDALVISPGILLGEVNGLPLPHLTAENGLKKKMDTTWVQNGIHTTLLLCQNKRFVLINGNITLERALKKAEDALTQPFDSLVKTETQMREKAAQLFSINPRHNPPVALAAEQLRAYLRSPGDSIHGLWSAANGFSKETFSLNELYPLICAWNLIDPSIALELVQTALSLQQSNGGFPAWVEANGLAASVAPWPLIAQSFELAWQSDRDPARLKRVLPALRKYALWAIRHFDPHHGGIPTWQSEQEIFVPNRFEQGKATPDLVVFLILEIEAVMRLCEKSDPPDPAITLLTDERDHLVEMLNRIFWDPKLKSFSNIWKNGDIQHEASFSSFLPLFWRGLDSEKQVALLNRFEETRDFSQNTKWNAQTKEMEYGLSRLSPIHQFMAVKFLCSANNMRSQLLFFLHRIRKNFTTWFEHENIIVMRHFEKQAPSKTSTYSLSPVTAALILTAQKEFQKPDAETPTAARMISRWIHRLRLNKTDLLIITICFLSILVIHLIYSLQHNQHARLQIGEASLCYQQGQYEQTIRICRMHPDNALSLFLQANISMVGNRPDLAESLYREALIKKTKSPSALLGLALALQMNGKFAEAAKRYDDFIVIHGHTQPTAAKIAKQFIRFSNKQLSTPLNWKRIYAFPLMNNLGL